MSDMRSAYVFDESATTLHTILRATIPGVVFVQFHVNLSLTLIAKTNRSERLAQPFLVWILAESFGAVHCILKPQTESSGKTNA